MKKKLSDIVLDLFGSFAEPDGPARREAPPAPAPTPPASKASSPRPSPAPAPPSPSKSSLSPDPERTSATTGLARTEAEVLAIARQAGGTFARVVFTRNRRIMASVGDRGASLRLNEVFAGAPEEVLRAAALLFTTRSARTRDQAREAVRRFLAGVPPAPAAPRRPRARTVHPLDRALVERLRAEFDRVNAEQFRGKLPAVPIYLSRKMRRRNGHFSAQPLEIVINRRLCTRGAAGEAEQTLRHEMIHLWQYVEGLPVDHGAPFRRMAKRLDVHPRATRRVQWEE